jgi:threonyl-tRNA synthetase
MFLVETDETTYSLKPMNCPESTYAYRHKIRSYKDLPLRFSEVGRLHRNEISGALGGMFRVRQITMDDAHIYCRPDQIPDEAKGEGRCILTGAPSTQRVVMARAY